MVNESQRQPGLAIGTTAARRERQASIEVGGRPAPSSRLVLAHHLGVAPEALASLRDAEVVGALQRMDALVERLAELESRAVHDDLTRALRRGAGFDALRLELARARRSNLPLAVVFLDVDGLKGVNDTHGHAAGDTLLCTVASTLHHRLRATDLVIRHGGDEFVCVLPGATPAAAEQVMSEIAAEIAQATGGSTISVGIAAVDPGSDEVVDPVSLVGAADSDLYRRRADRDARSAAS